MQSRPSRCATLVRIDAPVRASYATRALLVVAVLVASVAFDPAGLEAFSLPKLAALSVLGGLAIVCTAVSWPERVRIPRTAFWWRLGAYVGAIVIATLASQARFLSLFGLRGRYDGLLPNLLYVATAAAVVVLFWRVPLSLRWVAIAVCAGAVLCAAYVVVQVAHLDPMRWGATGSRVDAVRDAHARNPVGTIGHRDFVGGQVALALPLLAGLGLGATGRRRVGIIASGTLLLAALWFSSARGGMLAAVAGVLAMALAVTARPPRWLRRAAVVLVLATLAIGALVAWQRDFLTWDSHKSSVAKLTDRELLDPGTLVARTYIWQAAWRTFASDPITGTGPDTFYANYTRHRVEADGGFNGTRLADEPHNIYLAHAAGTGVLGLGAYLLVCGSALVHGFRRARRATGAERVLLSAFVGGLVAYLVQGLVSIDIAPLAPLGWVLVAAVVVLADPGIARSRLSPPRLGSVRRVRWRVVAVAAAVPVLAGMVARPLQANEHARRGYEAMKIERPYERARTELAHAIDLDPREPDYRHIAGNNAERAGRYVLADRHYRDALRIAPRHPIYLIARARAAGFRAEQEGVELFPAADRAWRTVVRGDPMDYEVHEGYASMLNAWANGTGDPALRRRTAAQLERALALRPDRAVTWVSLAKVYLALGDNVRAHRALAKALRIQPGNAEAMRLSTQPPEP